MSLQRTRYLMSNRDPSKVARLKAVLDRVYDQQVLEIEALCEAEIETPYRVDPKSARAGEQFLAQHSKMSGAKSAR